MLLNIVKIIAERYNNLVISRIIIKFANQILKTRNIKYLFNFKPIFAY